MLTARVSNENGNKRNLTGGRLLNIELSFEEGAKPRFRVYLNQFEDGSQNIGIVDLEKPYPNTVWEERIK